MCENVNLKCACDEGYDKGVLKKTIENNIFTIYGHLNQKNTIVVRYHGELTNNELNETKEFNIFYYFDNMKQNTKTIKLQKCTKCIGECYCCTLDLDSYRSLHFGFFDNYGNYELSCNTIITLDIAPDPISSLMQRYGFEENTNLPTYEKNNDNLFAFKSIFNSIKLFFNNIFKTYKEI